MTPSESAAELIVKLELKGLCPLPLQKVVEHLEYTVQLFQPNDKTRSLACGVDQTKKVLMANSADSALEQRYAFAHAIGHIVLHPGENVIDRKNNLHHTNEEQKEWEANQFADCLLMDEDLFLSKWDECNGDIGKIAGVFGMPKERVSARAVLLGIA